MTRVESHATRKGLSLSGDFGAQSASWTHASREACVGELTMLCVIEAHLTVDRENTALLTELMLQAEMFCARIEEATSRLPRTNDVDELRMKISQCRGALAVLQGFYEKDLLSVENTTVSGTFRQLIMSLLWVSFQASGHVDRRLFRKLVQIESGFTYLLLATQSRKT